jgi:hypothetical protein
VKHLRMWQDDNHSDDKEWVDYFEKLKIVDEKMRKDYAGEIENFLTFVRPALSDLLPPHF